MAATRKAAARTRAAVIPFPQPASLAFGRLLPSGRAVLLALAALAVASGAYVGARTTSVFAVESVEVRGAPPSLEAEVRRALEPAGGRSLLAVDLGALEASVLDLPDVASVRWDRAFPHELVVTVEPERPAVVLRSGSEAWLVSERGRVLRPLELGAHTALPRIWVRDTGGVSVGGHLREPAVTDALRALRPLPADFPVRVRSVSVAAADGSLVFDLDGGLELRLGDGRQLPLKLAVAASIVPSLPPPVAGGPVYLDVSVPERPVTAGTLKSKVEP